MADIPVLVCTAGDLDGQVIRVPPDGGLKIGRASENDVVIRDDGVSRFHATLLYDNGSLWLQDVGSRNGVFVNDARVTGHRALKVGDVIEIAQHKFAVRWGADVADGAPEPDESQEPRKGRRWFWPFQ